MLDFVIVYHPFVSINPSLESVNLWNTFPDPTFNVPIPAQDGTYMAETLTNDLDNMEYVAPRFYCPTPNVYYPFFTININITFIYATFPVPFATLILPSHSHRTPPPFHSHLTPPPSHSLQNRSPSPMQRIALKKKKK
ncbi:unnamed protein product [Bursaphelenchus xylophilus]|uniref:(pine wood nematode) hypothetical protein n=1 Tax=Bursaphelenchus xylophilus TaxID=6326 RepID=A0A811K723_BURXY|nr:unnamed protein product [Bursaphelenchus xylophilus]CAG9088502.1 unnamed protein product [Bursaphelenchus xylophilus]